MTDPAVCDRCGQECVPDTDHHVTTWTCPDHGWHATTFDEPQT